MKWDWWIKVEDIFEKLYLISYQINITNNIYTMASETIFIRKDNTLYWTVNFNKEDNMYTTDWVLWDNVYPSLPELFVGLMWHWIEIDKHVFY